MAYPRSIRPDYSTGTITLTSGSKNFTTVGSSLESANVFAGDLIMSPTGLVLIIDEITGQNSGTLMEPCPAMAAGSGIPVRIRFQPDGSRFQAAYRELAMAQTGGNLAAFADLVGAMDMVPVFTGPGAIALVAKSEFGPTDTHGNLVELAGLAKENNQFIVMDASGNVALKPISDVTDAIQANTDAINLKFTLPSGGDSSQLIDGTGALTSKVDLPISNSTQSAIDLINTNISDLQSYGTNANGEFWRFKSGLQITGRISGTYTIASPAGNIFVNGAAQEPYDLAAAFIAAPYEIITSHNFSGVGHSWAASVTRPSATKSSSVQLFRATSDSGSFFFRLVHIGRWK